MQRTTARALDVARIREDFPILGRMVVCKPLVYLDNAATAQKPQFVIDAVRRYYEDHNSNVHRGVHHLSQLATAEYEKARDRVRAFLNAGDRREIVFVRGTTEAINLVAQSFVRPTLAAGDEIVVTHMEHHSNIVPWQLLEQQAGAVLEVVPIDDRGDMDLAAYETLLASGRVRLVSVVHVSNALGTVNPVREVIRLAHARGIPVLLDGAQAAPHLRVDVSELDCEFYAFSGHKLFGPTGIGALYGKAELLDAMPPYQGGGEMIRSVSFSGTTFADSPAKFEAGTPHIAGAVGLGAAIEYLRGLDRSAVEAHERDLLVYATGRLREVAGLRIIGEAREKVGVVSFVMTGVHPHDVGTILDQEGIAIRVGHHCAQPVMERFGVPATARASFAFYNTRAEVDQLVAGLARVRELFHP